MSFTLDSECHPYIDAYIEPRNLGHLFLESEFEKYMMRKMELILFIQIFQTLFQQMFKQQSYVCIYETLDETSAQKVLKELRRENG